MRPVPPSIDRRNAYQKSLDTAVRKTHEFYGDTLEGFILIAYGDDIGSPVVSIHCDIDIEDIPEYTEAVTKWAIDVSKETIQK